jgi:hypothetical protein
MFPLRYKFQTEEAVYARIVNSNFPYLENNSKLSNTVIKSNAPNWTPSTISSTESFNGAAALTFNGDKQ